MEKITNFDLLLASKSPRRQELLQQIGVNFSVVAVDVVECRDSSESAQDYVHRLACRKAEAGYNMYEQQPTLGADTIVVCDSDVLEKPRNYDDFLSMMNRLSGRKHDVYTAVCLHDTLGSHSFIHRTHVFFRDIDHNEATRYWQSGEPQDKAGGYGIQGRAAVFVEHIEGSYSGVVGLPLYETAELLSAYHVPIWQN